MDPLAITSTNIQECEKYLQLNINNFQDLIKNSNVHTMAVAIIATYELLFSTLVPTEKKAIYKILSNYNKASSTKLLNTVNLNTGSY